MRLAYDRIFGFAQRTTDVSRGLTLVPELNQFSDLIFGPGHDRSIFLAIGRLRQTKEDETQQAATRLAIQILTHQVERYDF